MEVSGQFHFLAALDPKKNIQKYIPYSLDMSLGGPEIKSVLSWKSVIRARTGYRIPIPRSSIPYSSLIHCEVHRLHTEFSFVH